MDSGHIGMSPCEEVFILLKYLIESFCFLRREKGASIGEAIIFF